MKTDLLYRQRWYLLYLPLLTTVCVLLFFSYSRWLPMAPRTLTIVAGVSNDNYNLLAVRYAALLEQIGINTEIVPLASPHTGLQALQELQTQFPDRPVMTIVSGYEASLPQPSGPNPMHSPSEKASQNSTMVAIAAVEREPVWIFSRGTGAKQVVQLDKQRIAVPSGDMLSSRAARLLIETSAGHASATLMEIAVEKIANALLDGSVDSAILLASVDSTAVKNLLRDEKIQLQGLASTGKVLAHEPRLHPFVLPQGVIEFRGNVPAYDISLVAADVQLVTHATMHPALQRAIFEVATQIHEQPRFLQRKAEFPSVSNLDFATSRTSMEAMRGDRPIAEQLLPYGWAQRVQWLVFAGLPIIGFALIVMAWLPSLTNWKSQAVLQNFYGELKFLESEIESVNQRPMEMKKLLQQLDAIEIQIMQFDMPNSQTDRWYTLRTHLSQARDKLLGMRAR